MSPLLSYGLTSGVCVQYLCALRATALGTPQEGAINQCVRSTEAHS